MTLAGPIGFLMYRTGLASTGIASSPQPDTTRQGRSVAASRSTKSNAIRPRRLRSRIAASTRDEIISFSACSTVFAGPIGSAPTLRKARARSSARKLAESEGAMWRHRMAPPHHTKARAQSLFETLLNVDPSFVPTLVIAAMAATEINAAIRPYSIAVAPRLLPISFKNLLMVVLPLRPDVSFDQPSQENRPTR